MMHFLSNLPFLGFTSNVSSTCGTGLIHRARVSLAVVILACVAPVLVQGQTGGGVSDNTPTTDTDVSSLISTGCGYDAWTGSVRREVVDFQVATPAGPGLTWARTYNSSTGTWSFSYSYAMAYRPYYNVEHIKHPDGRTSHFEVGSKERLFDAGSGWQRDNTSHGDVAVYMGDGSIVRFSRDSERIPNEGQDYPKPGTYDSYTPLGMEDRYGHKVSFQSEQGDAEGRLRLASVTDETGRWIKILYQDAGRPFAPTLVYGSDGQWVKYTYQNLTYGTNPPITVGSLVRADYSDGTFARYGYGETEWGETGGKTSPVLVWARDTRASTAMQNIYYEYNTRGRFQGQILAEHYLNPDDTMGVTVSRFTSASYPAATEAVQTENRGDGPTCQIKMRKLNEGKGPPFTIHRTDYNGVQQKFGYNGNFFVNSVTDHNQNTTNFNLEKIIGNPLSRIHPDTNHIDYTYTDSFYPYYLKTIKDENGKVTTFNRNSATAAVNRGMVTSIDYPDGGREEFTHNSFGQVIKHRLKKSGGAADPIAFEYAQYEESPTSPDRGLLRKAWVPTTVDSTPGQVPGSVPFTQYTYYQPNEGWPGRIKQVTDPNGNRTSYVYDDGTKPLVSPAPTDAQGNTLARRGRGLTKTVTYVDDTHAGETPSYPLGTQQNFGYDDYGNKTSEKDELNHETQYFYDDYMRVWKTIDPLGNETRTFYTATNGASAYTHTTKNWRQMVGPPSCGNSAGIKTGQLFDVNFRLWKKIQAEGSSVQAITTFQYDNNGNPTSVTDPRNNTTLTIYDTRNRKRQTIGPPVPVTGGATVSQTTIWDYDNVGNVLKVTRPDNTTEVNTYDAMNRVLTHKEGDDQHLTIFTYYASGKVATVKDARNNVTTFSYDAADFKTKMLYQNNDYQEYKYDNNHNLVSRRTAATSGVYQKFQYDARNRKKLMWWGTNQSELVTNDDITWTNGIDRSTFVYDGAGRLTTAANNFSTVTRDYDDAGRLKFDDQNLVGGVHKKVEYTFNSASENTRLFVNAGTEYDEAFCYDAMGRFSTVSGSGAQFNYTYDTASNVTHRARVGGIDQDYGTPDAVNRMTKRELKYGGSRIAAPGAYESYIYDKMNRLSSVTREDGKIDSFGYNAPGELTSASYQWSNRSVSYTLDLVGNRTSVLDGNVTKTYVPDNINRYTTAENSAVNSGPQHQIGSFQNTNYFYVGDSYVAQITQPTQPGSPTYTPGYDPLGRCVKRTMTISGNTTISYFIFDGEKPILEYNTSGGPVAISGKNVYGKGIDEILMRSEYPSNLTYYYQDDHAGSVTHLILANGTVIESYRYDAFGAPTITTNPSYSPNNRFMFTGREYIKQFGIYEYRARAYHPGIGRFVSEDPKGFDGGDYNLFRYCNNDPLDLTDPMGLATAPGTSPTGAVVNPPNPPAEDKNLKWYRLYPSSFTSQLLEGPGIPSSGQRSADRGQQEQNYGDMVGGRARYAPLPSKDGDHYVISDTYVERLQKLSRQDAEQYIQSRGSRRWTWQEATDFLWARDTALHAIEDQKVYYDGDKYAKRGYYEGSAVNYIGIGVGANAMGMTRAKMQGVITIHKMTQYFPQQGFHAFRGGEFAWADAGYFYSAK